MKGLGGFMTLTAAVVFFIVAIAGIAVSAVCLRDRKGIRTAFIILFSLIAFALAVYIGLTFIFVDAASNKPADASIKLLHSRFF